MDIWQRCWRYVARGGAPHAQESAKVGQSDGPGVVVIEAQLARILKSAAFEASTRNRNFLSYIVNLTINGRQDRIKAYRSQPRSLDATRLRRA